MGHATNPHAFAPRALATPRRAPPLAPRHLQGWTRRAARRLGSGRAGSEKPAA